MPIITEQRPMSNTVENASAILKNAAVMAGGTGTAVASPAMSFPGAVQLIISIIGCMVGVWGGYHLRQNWKENKRRNDIYDRDVSLKEREFDNKTD